jgi:hypothetical protein
MISVIISSANCSLLTRVVKNIEDTISVPFEIIAFDNSKGEKGICEIYNLGIQKARYEILCFMHEDIEIKTYGWGQTIINKFNKTPGLGLVGVAGNSYKTLTPSGWHGAGTDTSHHNYIQSNKNTKKEPVHYYRNPNNEELSEVASIDGLWFCTTKKIASEFMFDEITFKKFHAYDIDFSLSVGQKYKVAVIYDIVLNHFSEGKYDDVWMEENLKLHNKWNKILPVNVGNVSPEKALKIEKKAFKKFINQLIYFKYPILVALSTLTKNIYFYYNRDPLLFLKFYYYIFLKYLKLGKPV